MTLTSNTPITKENAALYERAVMFATRDKPSTSYLQRRLQIGYNQAASLIERMQGEGLISRPNSAGKREILVPYTDRPALAKPAEGIGRCRIGSCQRHRECMYTPCRATPTPPSVDWSVVGPKLVEAAKTARAMLAAGSDRRHTLGVLDDALALAPTQPQSNGD